VEEYNIGWRLATLTTEAYQETIDQVFSEWSSEQQVAFRQRARAFVERDRNVKVFQDLYYKVFTTLE